MTTLKQQAFGNINRKARIRHKNVTQPIAYAGAEGPAGLGSAGRCRRAERGGDAEITYRFSALC